MRQLILGIVIGSTLTAGLGLAASSFYDSKGNVQAPRGSQQQYDYFRQRQQFLDIAATRRAAEQMERENRLHPCGR